ncbi:MAG TPA: aldo/keto reductase [Actinomycetota bacterium]|nr:aldo/keto reductase [Actinomycetota bacterium]
MDARDLGPLRVGAVGLGCMPMHWAYLGDADDRSSIEVIHRALELGVTHFDTADVYGPHTNEDLVGRALEGHVDAVIATKVGFVVGPDGGYPLDHDARPEHIRAAIDGQLGRLRRDVIDLYSLHRVDPNVPLEESWGAMAELVTAGKVRSLGMSEVSVAELARAHAVHPVAAVQSELSLWTRDALAEVVPWCAEHGAGFVPFAPLGRGFLTGAITAAAFRDGDFRATNPRFTDDAIRSNLAIVDAVRAIAERLGATPAQVAIAWCLAQGPHVVPIPGTKRRAYLEDNVAAAALQLDDATLRELDALPAPTAPRY